MNQVYQHRKVNMKSYVFYFLVIILVLVTTTSIAEEEENGESLSGVRESEVEHAGSATGSHDPLGGLMSTPTSVTKIAYNSTSENFSRNDGTTMVYGYENTTSESYASENMTSSSYRFKTNFTSSNVHLTNYSVTVP